MFRVTYDGPFPRAEIDADEFDADSSEDWVTFTKGRHFVSAVRTTNILSIDFVGRRPSLEDLT